MKLKYGEYVVHSKNGVGMVLNPGVNQECLTINWLTQREPCMYYHPKQFANECEALPKDVAENLIAVLTKE